MQPVPKPPRTPATGHDTYRTGARRSTKPSADCENRPSHQTQYPRFHELAHAIVRLDRRPEDPELDYASEELVAESVAFTCVRSLGIAAEEYSIPYLTSWAEDTDLDVLEQTAGLIDRLASRIETALHTEPADNDVNDVGEPEAMVA
jgi:antirestriction protein ArdC